MFYFKNFLKRRIFSKNLILRNILFILCSEYLANRSRYFYISKFWVRCGLSLKWYKKQEYWTKKNCITFKPKVFLLNNHLLAEKIFFFFGKIQSVNFPTVNKNIHISRKSETKRLCRCWWVTMFSIMKPFPDAPS